MQIKPNHAPSGAAHKPAAARPAADAGGDFAKMLKTAQAPGATPSPAAPAATTTATTTTAPPASPLAGAFSANDAPSTAALAASPLRA